MPVAVLITSLSEDEALMSRQVDDVNKGEAHSAELDYPIVFVRACDVRVHG